MIFDVKFSPYMFVATVAYGLMVLGIFYRKRRKPHAQLMSAAMVIDTTLVLLLQVKRNAVQTALAFSLTPLEQGHIGASTAALLLYLPVSITGWGRYRGKLGPQWRKAHVVLGSVAFIFRTLGFLLMFSLLNKN